MRPPGASTAAYGRRGPLIFALFAATLSLVASRPAVARRVDEPSLERVSSHLRAARLELLQHRQPAESLARVAEDGFAPIELRFDALTPTTVERIRTLGVRIDHVSYRYGRVLAAAPLTLLADLAGLPGLATIHPAYGAVQNAGAVAGQGDPALRGDAARTHFGVDGSGRRVGILSDSFHERIRGTIAGSGCERMLTGASSQASGDLPTPVVVLTDGLPRSSDEGAALGEVVHDIAPGASLLFASAYPDEATFAENIDALVACGSDILVDDIMYFTEPMFQDGIVAQAAQAAVDSGVAFFSAVGNNDHGGIDATYADVNPNSDDEADPPTGDDFHAFTPGRAFAPITVPASCGIRAILQWDEPFSAGLGAGASTDLDLYLLSAENPRAVLQSGSDTQGCALAGGGPGGDPIEMLAYINQTGQPQTVFLAIDHFCGRRDVRFRVVTFPTCTRQPLTFDPEIFTGPQVYGHAAAAGVAAVAAVSFVDAAGSGSAVHVEPFSAKGGDIPLVLDAQGQPLADGPVTRFKPELSAPDGVNTTFFGLDSSLDADTFPNFFGTSAAAPHVAAVAALMRETVPSISPAQILTMLRATARDIEAPGRDDVSGDGLVDAYAALDALLAQPTPQPTPTATPVPIPGDCNGDGHVTVDELIVGVRIALGTTLLGNCVAIDGNGNGSVEINELITAVRAALT